MRCVSTTRRALAFPSAPAAHRPTTHTSSASHFPLSTHVPPHTASSSALRCATRLGACVQRCVALTAQRSGLPPTSRIDLRGEGALPVWCYLCGARPIRRRTSSAAFLPLRNAPLMVEESR